MAGKERQGAGETDKDRAVLGLDASLTDSLLLGGQPSAPTVAVVAGDQADALAHLHQGWQGWQG